MIFVHCIECSRVLSVYPCAVCLSFFTSVLGACLLTRKFNEMLELVKEMEKNGAATLHVPLPNGQTDAIPMSFGAALDAAVRVQVGNRHL